MRVVQHRHAPPPAARLQTLAGTTQAQTQEVAMSSIDTNTAADTRPTFSDAEYRRRWQAVADRLDAHGLDGMAVTGPLNVPYLAGYDDCGTWPSPVIVTVDTASDPVFVAREYDADTIRAESRIPRVVTFIGDDDHTRVWADALVGVGLERGRLGIDPGTYGATPADIAALQRLLPELQIIDATSLINHVTAVKSAEEVAVMRQAMAYTRVGIETFHAALHEGADEQEVWNHMQRTMVAAGSERDDAFTLLLGQRTSRPHSASAPNRMQMGDVAFTEVGGQWQGYFAGLCRTAILGRNEPAKELYAIAREALEAALAVIRPGVTSGEIDRACRGVIQRAGRSETFRHRSGYAIGFRWTGRGNISLHPSGTDVIEEQMTLHLPIILFQQGQFGVGVSETVLVTADGAEALSGLPRDLVHV